MPKQVQKHGRTAKHKDSAAKQARKEKKEMKANGMETESVIEARQLSEEEKESAKAARKKLNAHKMFYKKNNYSMTGRNGPRAVTE
eukprot:CAMPEP_0170382754 /NCGR_PEP_ID=MMETSP0117_2-20130122/15115_1 /TAXON_ID=400756 /ORGANISM="Durinskia baltica, Strain CSIRO CS-38" /LENGTH=85 /DNA_ID=CAMNT_0010638421 /DNA_START=51 /DNA_END=308 /DNA_ORIENTATION=-